MTSTIVSKTVAMSPSGLGLDAEDTSASVISVTVFYSTIWCHEVGQPGFCTCPSCPAKLEVLHALLRNLKYRTLNCDVSSPGSMAVMHTSQGPGNAASGAARKSARFSRPERRQVSMSAALYASDD